MSQSTPTSVRLVISVDTEEDGLWKGDFPQTNCTVENLNGLDRFQAFCSDLGVAPTYLIDWPVAEDTDTVSKLAYWQEEEKCEVGAHLHPWCNPPVREQADAFHSYLCNLPLELQESKVATLTDLIASRIGRAPTSFRSGRYGLSSEGIEILEEHGYLVDSSVTPFFNWSGDGGPDYRYADWRPYYPHESEISRPGPRRRLLEIPITCGFTLGKFDRVNAPWQRLASSPWRHLRIIGLLDRTRLCQRIPLSPEKATASEMIRLMSASVRNGADILVMILHSSSLAVGYSPYVKTDEDLEEFYARIKTAILFCRDKLSGEILTLTQAAAAWRQENDEKQPTADAVRGRL